MTARKFQLESFTLDLDRYRLEGPSGRIELRRKSFEVLRYLVENAGRVVTKEEILNTVWPAVTVGDESLTQCISEVRRAFGDKSRRIVRTIPRRGYLIDVPVLLDAPGLHPGATADENVLPALSLPDRPSIAVLAFANMTGDASQDYLADGVSDDIITELSRFSELFVIARNSSFTYKGRDVDVRQVGRELGVRYVLEGSVRRAADRIRITAQLLDAQSGAHRWAERYDREPEEAFELHDEVTRTIVAMLAAHVNRAEIERALLKPPVSWRAHDCYLRAASYFSLYMSTFKVEELYEARRLLEQTVSTDPTYARAHALLSWAYLTAWLQPLDDDYHNPATLEKAYRTARLAVQLDPNLPVGYAQLGYVLNWKSQFETAIAAFEKAIALNPNHTDWRFAASLVSAGEHERAVQMGKAHMRLDPFYPPLTSFWLGAAYYLLSEYAQAIRFLSECVARAPNLRSGHTWLAAAYAQMGQHDGARAEAAEALRIQPDYTIEGIQRQRSYFRLSEDTEHLCAGLRKAGLPKK
jgi:adenylate cyclase